MSTRHKVTTFLWYDDNAEEAASFYVSLFDDAEILEVTHYGEGNMRPAGTVMTVTFDLAGQRYTAINGGPHYTLTPAVSLQVSAESQAEVDRLWDRLTSDGGKEVQCGWLEDRFGLSWQIVPAALFDMMRDSDPAKSQRLMAAMFPMRKLDLAALERAWRGESE
jgi:predicted 3-demethylubiquinone-9 3-methyltransferase (glyoxalase superfamily)